jgi:hypothetical protein
MYKLEIKIPLYDCICTIIISKDIEKVINRYVKRKKWHKDYLVDDHTYLHGYAVSPENMTEYAIFYKDSSLTVNTVVHEITHMVDFILEERSIENEAEAKAYLTGHISEKVFDFIFKKNLLINKWYKPVISNDEKPNRLLRESNEGSQRTEEGTSGSRD